MNYWLINIININVNLTTLWIDFDQQVKYLQVCGKVTRYKLKTKIEMQKVCYVNQKWIISTNWRNMCKINLDQMRRWLALVLRIFHSKPHWKSKKGINLAHSLLTSNKKLPIIVIKKTPTNDPRITRILISFHHIFLRSLSQMEIIQNL